MRLSVLVEGFWVSSVECYILCSVGMCNSLYGQNLAPPLFNLLAILMEMAFGFDGYSARFRGLTSLSISLLSFLTCPDFLRYLLSTCCWLLYLAVCVYIVVLGRGFVAVFGNHCGFAVFSWNLVVSGSNLVGYYVVVVGWVSDSATLYLPSSTGLFGRASFVWNR